MYLTVPEVGEMLRVSPDSVIRLIGAGDLRAHKVGNGESAPVLASGAAIRRARQRKGWTQVHLASALGVSVRAVNDWENDRAVPRMLAQVEEVLGLAEQGHAYRISEADLQDFLDRAAVRARAEAS